MEIEYIVQFFDPYSMNLSSKEFKEESSFSLSTPELIANYIAETLPKRNSRYFRYEMPYRFAVQGIDYHLFYTLMHNRKREEFAVTSISYSRVDKSDITDNMLIESLRRQLASTYKNP